MINVKDFGAKGDGINDDTSALQDAIDYCITNNKTLFIPPGTYKVTDTILIESTNISIIGSGYGGLSTGVCIIKSFITTSTKDIISINPSHQELDGSTFQGFKILGSGSEQHGIACYATPHRNNVYRDIRVHETGGDGWHFEGEGYLEVFDNCFGDHCIGWGFNFIGGQSWASGNKLTMGQCSMLSCWSEFCNSGNLRVYKGLDLKVFGGQFNALKNDGATQNPASIQITDSWGADFYGSSMEQGITGLLVDGTTFKVSLFGGRLFNQSGDYSINLNQSGSTIHGGCSINGTSVSKGICISSDNYGTKIDAVAETSNPNAITILDNGYMTEISPRILAMSYSGKYYNPKFGITSQKFANLNNISEHVLMEQKDGVFEFGYNTEQGTAALPFKSRYGIQTTNHTYSSTPLILGSYYLWVDTSGRLRIKSSAPTSDIDGTAVGAQTK